MVTSMAGLGWYESPVLLAVNYQVVIHSVVIESQNC